MSPHDAPAAHPHLSLETITRFVADELRVEEALEAGRHLDSCDPCTARLEAAEPALVFRRLRTLRATESEGARLWAAVRQAVPPAQRPAGAQRTTWARRGAVRVGLAVAATLAAVLVLVVVSDPGAGPDEDGAPDVAGASATSASPQGPSPLVAPSPCPATVAALKLTADECAALFRDAFGAAGPPQVVLAAGLDLRGL